MMAGVVADLRHAIGDDGVHDRPGELSLYRKDASNMEGVAGVVCFPRDTEQVRRCVDVARRHQTPFTARGSGTGLAGGAIPLDEAIVISTSKMTSIESVDVATRRAWVQPGVLNLDLTRTVAPFGLHFAPDPSSQQVCTIGGNVANNSGGPHCLSEGVTSAHVLAIEAVLADASVVTLGGEDPEPAGYDLRGAFVGSEGMCGIATKICVRLTPDPPAVATALVDFADIRAGASTVSAIIAAGVVPAALEMMDRQCLVAVEAYVHAGLPVDAACALLVEVAGEEEAVRADMEVCRRVAGEHGCTTFRLAADDAERALLWKARKSAFGAVARIKPNYYLHDTVVPRRVLPDVLDQVYEIVARHDLQVLNVFHAGDGNLHPLLVYDRREPGVTERVAAAGREIVTASVAAGGVLSGEHGIGLEKRELMPLMFDGVSLAAQAALRSAFDPDGIANPFKVLPSASSCADVQALAEPPADAWI